MRSFESRRVFQREPDSRFPPKPKPVDLTRSSVASKLQRNVGNGTLHELLQRSLSGGTAASAFETAFDRLVPTHDGKDDDPVLAPGGSPLPSDARVEMEARFGVDLGSVRIHAEDRAAEASGARAFASGHNIRFAPGHGASDRSLLAHEIAHVLQQAAGETRGLRGGGGAAAQRAALERTAAQRANLLADTIACEPLPPTSGGPAVLQFDFEQDVKAELHRIPSAEDEGLSEPERLKRAGVLAGRKSKLMDLFESLAPREAVVYQERLAQRNKGDTLSERFHDLLSTSLRRQLLGILERKVRSGPTTGDILRLNLRVPIQGLASAQSNYADRAFERIESAPIGDDYTLVPRSTAGGPPAGIPIPKNEFQLDKDPLTGFVVGQNQVYPSRRIAEAVLADLNRVSPDIKYYTYYLKDGVIFPTTLSETTLPNLTPQLRNVRESARRDIAAMADLAEQVAWWYVGARFPVRVGSIGKVGAAGTAVTVGKATLPAFEAARMGEELAASTGSMVNPGQRMLAAARELSALKSLTAVQKTQVMLEFFDRIGFVISKAGVVDDGARLLMYSEDSRYAFEFLKQTGVIRYGRFDMALRDYVWQAIQ